MAYTVRRVDYFYTTVKDRPGEAFRLLTRLAGEDVNLLAFNTVPMGPDVAQLALFPEKVDLLVRFADYTGVVLNGPNPALMVQGDDRLGALAEVHAKLFDARINVYAATAITDGKGCYGYIIYVRPEEVDRAVEALAR